jgi:ring-1,2-phenylacetyl-CoA epoxidase subunit PaaE
MMNLLPSRWSGTFDQWKRDARMVRRRLAGDAVSPILRAGPRVDVRPRKERELIIARVIREAADTTTLVLLDPSGVAFAFEPGQFFTVHADGGVLRNYSASNVPGQQELHLSIKRKPGGLVSGRLCDAEAGARLRVTGPYGAFVRQPQEKELVLFAGGSGITPLFSIAQTALARDPDVRITLVYGSRSPADVIFGDAIDALAQTCERFRVVHVFGEHGLDRATAASNMAPLAIDATYFVCGPDGMRAEVLAGLEAAGVPSAHIRVESFMIGRRPRAMARPPIQRGPALVEVRVRGRTFEARALSGASLLDAGLAAGAPMPFSCGVGGCGACRVKLVSGDVAREEPNCLTREEREAGYVLACVGRPNGPCRIDVEES